MDADARSGAAADRLEELPPLAPGDHVCWVVEDDAGFGAAAQRCLDAGREAGEKLFYFGPRATLAGLPVDVSVADPTRDYLGGGALDAGVMLAVFREQMDLARAEGYSGLRLVADMDWLLAHPPLAGDLGAFELQADMLAHEIGATIVCAYRRRSFDDEQLESVVATHPMTAGFGGEPGWRFVSGGHERWLLSGEVDVRNGKLFERLVRTMVDAADEPTLDLHALVFIDIAGMRAIADAAGGGRRMRIEQAGPVFRRAWDLLDHARVAPFVELAA